MKSTIAALSCILIGMATAKTIVNNGKVHEVMTTEELKHVFNAHSNDDVPDYEVVSIRQPKFQKRSYGSVADVPLAAFGREVTLSLQPTDGILAGYGTSIYTIETDERKPNGHVIKKYTDDTMAMIEKYLEDRATHSSMIVRRSADGRTTISGHVGSEGWTVKPLPGRLIRNIGNGSIDDEIGDHVIYATRGEKNPKKMNYRSTDMVEDSIKNRFTRSTRPIPSIVYIQICVVVDYETYKLHGENLYQLVEYLLAFWNGVDLRYRSLENPKIRFNIATIVIALDSEALSFISNNKVYADMVNIDKALKDFGIFMKKKERTFSFESYDIAVAMSPFRMGSLENGSWNDETQGEAWIASACSRGFDRTLSTTVIRDVGGYKGIDTAAHEIGHLLGAKHDGDDNPECSKEVGNIMAPSNGLKESSAYWSKCSVKQFENFFKSKASDCLDNKPITTSIQSISLPGEILTADQQCQKIYGSNACRFPDKDICEALFCKETKSTCRTSSGAADGTPCGENKICLHHKCQFKDDIQ